MIQFDKADVGAWISLMQAYQKAYDLVKMKELIDSGLKEEELKELDRNSTRLNSSHIQKSSMPSSS